MNQFDIEWELSKALEHSVPDVKNEILRRCAEEHFSEDSVVPMDFCSRPQRRRNYWQSYVAAAVILILLINMGIGLGRDRAQKRVETIIGLDVNPSIELHVNAQDRIVAVLAVNADANIVLKGMELTGSTTDVAVNAILGSMYKNGYLGASSNSILVSVDNKNEEVSREIETRLVEDINETLQSYSLEAAILSQTVVQVDNSVTQTASDYEMSQGRTLLIQKIIDNNPDYTFEELSQLTINELNLLLSSQNVEVQTVSVVGVASESSYIGQSVAIENVLSQFTGNRDELRDLYVDIGVRNARMVYGVSYLYGDVIYIYDVDALTGEIVESSVDYPVMEVEPTTDITVSQSNSEMVETVSGSAEGKEDEKESFGSDGSDGQISGNETVSGNGTGNASEDVTGTDRGDKDTSVTGQSSAASGNTTSGNTASGNTASGRTASGNTASGNTASGRTTSGNTASGNMVSDNEIKDSDESAWEGKYSAIFMRRSGIPKGVELLWMEALNGKEEFGEYDDAWSTATKVRSVALTHAQLSRNDVEYTLAAVYSQRDAVYFMLEFETKTAAYQYIIDAFDGTIVEYEKRLL